MMRTAFLRAVVSNFVSIFVPNSIPTLVRTIDSGAQCAKSVLGELFERCCWLILGFSLLFIPGVLSVKADPEVNLMRTPENGLQPQAIVDSKGVVHLLYYRGDPRNGDLFYVSRASGTAQFSNPLRVTRDLSPAMAMGTIRGGQLALGKNSRVHVVWNGGNGAEGGPHPGAPLFYTRLNDTGTAFEPPRDLITTAIGLDGGSSVAADRDGQVYVFWHGRQPGSAEGEAGRALFLARSIDDGRTFAPERPALKEATGACGCCGMRAFADQTGAVYALFRAAAALTNRDELVIDSRDHGEHFEILTADRWVTPSCPMSSAYLSQAKQGALAAWETEGHVFFARVDPVRGTVSEPISAPGNPKAKHPVILENTRGELLFVWTEGTGWERGGAVAWQRYDRSGRPVGQKGRVDGLPVWSLAAAFATFDGNFVIVY
jgi:hypothetical protein